MTDNKTNETVLRDMIDVFWNEQNLDSFSDYFAEDAVLHSGKTDCWGDDGFKQGYAGGFIAAFPDLRHDIEFLIVDGDMAAMRIHGTAFFRMADERIAEVWSHSDMWQWAAAQ